MRKREENMKKFIILAAVAAMTCGAWAATYTFQLNLNNISSGGSGGSTDSTLYFVNTQTHEIYAYFSRSDLSTYVEGSSYGGGGIAQNYTTKRDGKSLVLPAGYAAAENAATLVTQAGISKTIHKDDSSIANVVYTMTFDASGVPYNTTQRDADGYLSGSTPELAAILVFDTGATMEYGDFTSKSMTESMVNYQATYIKPAPEPTSAMLLLLGMAGFALKRKVA